jgi:hypothetical protein
MQRKDTKGNERRREWRAIGSGVTAAGGRQVADGASYGLTIKSKSRRAKSSTLRGHGRWKEAFWFRSPLHIQWRAHLIHGFHLNLKYSETSQIWNLR